MKKTTLALTVTAALISSNAFADTITTPLENGKGFYIGTDLGYSKVNVDNALIDNQSFAQAGVPALNYLGGSSNYTSHDGGLGFNINGGYMFNQYIGVELGYTKYANVKSDRQASADIPYQGGTIAASSNYSTTYSLQALTLAAKGVYHFNFAPKVLVFGKLGIAGMYATSDVTATATANDNGDYISGTATLNGSASAVKPFVDAGLGYDVLPNLTINAGWSYAMGGNSMKDNTGTVSIDGDNVGDVPYSVALGNASLFYGGVEYHF